MTYFLNFIQLSTYIYLKRYEFGWFPPECIFDDQINDDDDDVDDINMNITEKDIPRELFF